MDSHGSELIGSAMGSRGSKATGSTTIMVPHDSEPSPPQQRQQERSSASGSPSLGSPLTPPPTCDKPSVRDAPPRHPPTTPTPSSRARSSTHVHSTPTRDGAFESRATEPAPPPPVEAQPQTTQGETYLEKFLAGDEVRNAFRSMPVPFYDPDADGPYGTWLERDWCAGDLPELDRRINGLFPQRGVRQLDDPDFNPDGWQERRAYYESEAGQAEIGPFLKFAPAPRVSHRSSSTRTAEKATAAATSSQDTSVIKETAAPVTPIRTTTTTTTKPSPKPDGEASAPPQTSATAARTTAKPDRGAVKKKAPNKPAAATVKRRGPKPKTGTKRTRAAARLAATPNKRGVRGGGARAAKGQQQKPPPEIPEAMMWDEDAQDYVDRMA